MSSAVAELDAYLQSMLSLKPPGVSGSKITNITSLCTANIQVCLTLPPPHCMAITDSFSLQSESVLIQKIYTHFKKTPGTHKLGVLYVVDSVTRQWVDQAKKSGQTPGSGAPDGTFAAGVTRVTELLPVLMNDIIATAPEDQKVRSTRRRGDGHTSVPFLSEYRIAAQGVQALLFYFAVFSHYRFVSYGPTHVL
jgi:protein NRD1